MFAEIPPYRSPLRGRSLSIRETEYSCPKTDKKLGLVYKGEDQRWYLSTKYFMSWQPLEVFSKYKGFLFLNELHKRDHTLEVADCNKSNQS